MHVLKKISVAVAVAMLAGVLLGGLSRALMRLVTVVGGGEPGFSWGGTLAIVLIYAVAALPVAVFAAFTTRWWRWIGGAAGTVFVAVPAAGITGEELGQTYSWTTLQWVGAIAVTVSIFATTVALPVVAIRLVDRALARRRLPRVAPQLATS